MSARQLTAGDIMTREVVTVSPEASVSELARLMAKRRVSGLPVVDQDRRVVGIVTEADLVVRAARPHFPHYLQFLEGVIFLENPRRYEEEIRKMSALTAGEIMTPQVVTISPEETVEQIATLMVERNINRLVVVEEGRLAGVVTRADVIRAMAREGG